MADEDGRLIVKCLHTFSPVKSSQHAIIKALPLKKRKIGFLVSTGNNFLYFIENNKLVNTFHFPSAIINVETCKLGSTNEAITAVTCTNDGKIWRVPLTKHRSKRSKQKGIVNQASSRDPSDNQGIFSDLLSETAQTAENEQSISSSSTNVTEVLPHQAMIFEPGVQNVIPLGENLLTNNTADTGHLLSIYRAVPGTEDGSEISYSPQASHRYKMDTGFSLAKDVCESTNKVVEMTTKATQPHMICLQSEGTRKLDSCHVLERSLFGQLFGSDLLLTDAAVLLFGTSYGAVLFQSLGSEQLGNNLCGNSTEGEKSESTSLNCVSNHKLLYHVEQCISGIHLAKLSTREINSKQSSHRGNSNDSDGFHGSREHQPCNAIVIVGGRDKVVICYTSSKADSCNECKYAEYNLPGPILCSSMSHTGDILVYSNGREIFVTNLTLTAKEQVSENDENCLPGLLSPVSFPIISICAIQSLKHSDTETSTADVINFVTLNSRGKLLEFSVPKLNSGSATPLGRISPEAAGQRLKELLVGIERTASQTLLVNEDLESQDKVLKALNVAVNMACNLADRTRCDGAESDQSSIDWTVVPVCEFYGSSGQAAVHLHCKINNNSNLVLPKNWSLVVKVQGSSPWPSSRAGQSVNVIHTTPLGNFDLREFVKLDIVLDSSMSTTHPLAAEVFLHFDLKSVLSQLPRQAFKPTATSEEGILLPLGTKVFDVLHFVQPRTGPHLHNPALLQPGITPLYLGRLLETLKALNPNGQPCGIANRTECQDICTAALQISHDCANFIAAEVKAKQMEIKTSGAAVFSIEASLLVYLFYESKSLQCLIERDTSIVSVMTVDRHLLTVQVKPLSTQSEKATMDNKSGFEVSLQAPTMSLLCCLHEAVVKRVKPAAMRNGERTPEGLRHLQKALKRVQAINSELMLLEDTVIRSRLSTGTTDREVLGRLCRLYSDLRHINLAIP